MPHDPIVIQAPMGDDPPTATLYYGADCRESLRRLPDKSVHMVATSPPYWGLRDYSNEPTVWGGDKDCDHEWGETIPGSNKGGSGTPTDKNNNRGEGYGRGEPRGQRCTKCNAWLGQLGLEPTPYEFVEHLVEIFAEVKRVLRDDGTLWLNLGDSYANPGIQSSALSSTGGFTGERMRDGKKGTILRAIPEGIKYKDLVGIPWMTAFALRADGWYLRSDIIWAKANPMPESVTDRPTKAHEYLFLLTKNEQYFYDYNAIKEPSRNKRSVWNVNTKPYRGAHFAVWPEDLVEPMVLAGTGEKGCCAKCGASYKRVVEKEEPDKPYEYKAVGIPGESEGRDQRTGNLGPGLPVKSVTWEMGCESTFGLNMNRPAARRAVELFLSKKLTQEHLDAVRSVGFGAEDSKKSQLQTGTGKNKADVQKLADEAKAALGSYYREFMSSGRQEDNEPPCDCPTAPLKRCVVLDPFSGSATTGKVANDHGRDYIGLDANESYLDMAIARLQGRAAPQETDAPEESSVMDLFG